MARSIRVLHVDDEPDLATLVSDFLRRENDRFDVETATGAREGLDRLADAEFDCVVSDYDMPEMDGIDFLERVRRDHPDLPFILFTGKGSEEVASEAISAGVTDYLQKETGTEQYAILANRIENAVERYVAEREVDWHRTVLRNMGEGVYVFDADYEFQFVNHRVEAIDVSTETWVGQSLSHLADSGMLSESEIEWIRTGADSLLTRETNEVRIEIQPAVPESADVAELRLTPLELRGESLVLGTTRDISKRKNHERELEQYETLVEKTTDVVTVLDSEGVIQYQSPSIERVLGYDPTDLEGEHVFEYIHPEDRDQVAERFFDLVSVDAYTTERLRYRSEHADGSWRWLESEGSNQRDDALGGYVITSRDVTERTERERERERYAAIANNMADGGFIVDGDWCLEHANETSLSYADVSLSDIKGQPVERLTEELAVSDEDAARFERALEEAFELSPDVDETVRVEVRLDLQRGGVTTAYHLIPVRIDGEKKVVATVRDVTERRRREEVLGALHDVTREFMQASDQESVADLAVETAATVLDQPISGVWLHDEAADTLEPVAESDLSSDLFDDLPTFERGDALAWEVFESGEGAVYDDVRRTSGAYNPDTPIQSEIIRPLGEYGVIVFGRTEPDAFDDIDVALASVLADTVEVALARADRESELRAQHRALQRQNERLDEFASVISHDLRNPLQVLEGSLEQAAETGEDVHFERAADAVDRMDRLVTDLLTLSQQGETITDPEPVRVGDLAEGCWTTVETSGATLTVETDRTVEADVGRLKQLLENLFRNAVEHGLPDDAGPAATATGGSDGGGRGGVGGGDSDLTVRVGDLTDERGFFVADDGAGIPEGERDAVFEAGYSTDSEGTGFGLSIVADIAEAHGWDVRLTDSTEGGARFEFVVE